MNELLTDRVMGIPAAVAKRLARVGTERFDEIVAMGNLVLVEAASRFRPGTIGRTGRPVKFSTYAFTCVRLKVRTLLGLEEQYQSRLPRLWVPEARTHDLSAVDDRDEWEWLTGGLTDRGRKLAEMTFRQGKTYREVAEADPEVGRHSYVGQLVRRVVKQMKDRAGVFGDTDGIDDTRRGPVRQDPHQPANNRERQPELDRPDARK